MTTAAATLCNDVQCLQQRALHASDPLPNLSPVVDASLQVPSSVAAKAESVLEQLKKQFKLEPVAKKEASTGEAVFNAEYVETVLYHVFYKYMLLCKFHYLSQNYRNMVGWTWWD